MFYTMINKKTSFIYNVTKMINDVFTHQYLYIFGVEVNCTCVTHLAVKIRLKIININNKW